MNAGIVRLTRAVIAGRGALPRCHPRQPSLQSDFPKVQRRHGDEMDQRCEHADGHEGEDDERARHNAKQSSEHARIV